MDSPFCPNKFTIGLTGGIGSGKTRVTRVLIEHGVNIIDTDVVAHALTAPCGLAVSGIAAAFGDQAINAVGAMDRTWMRQHVFSNPAARQRLEGIIHPLILAACQVQAAAAGGPYLVFVVPLLVESGHWMSRVHRICVVDCEPNTQMQRVQKRTGLTPQIIQRIIATQASRADRLAVAHDVINNGAVISANKVRANVDMLHGNWLAMAAQVGK